MGIGRYTEEMIQQHGLDVTDAEFWLMDYIAGTHDVTTASLVGDVQSGVNRVLRMLQRLVTRKLVVLLEDGTWELTDKGAAPFGGYNDEFRRQRDEKVVED